jgi:hypothetical protein
MSKKSFKGANPALQFIEQAEGTAAEEERESTVEAGTRKTQKTDNTHNTQYTDNTDTTNKQPVPPLPLEAARGERGEAGARSSGDGKETKSKRLNLLLQPSIFEDVTKIARMKQTSFNDLVNAILKEYAEREAETVRKFDNVFGAGRA